MDRRLLYILWKSGINRYIAISQYIRYNEISVLPNIINFRIKEQGSPMSTTLSSSIQIDGVKYCAAEVCHEQVQVDIIESGEGYIYRRMVVSNPSSANSPQITEPRVIDASIPCTGTARLHTMLGCNNNQLSFKPIDMDFAVGDVHQMAPCYGGSSNYTAAPFWDITIDGRVYLFVLGWTGQWVCTVERTENAIRFTAGMQYADFYLRPGESFNLPSVCILEGKEGEDAAAVRRRFRRLMMTEMNPLPKNVKKLPIAIGPYSRYEFYYPNFYWHTYGGQMDTIRAARRMGGIDTHWLDAGWFEGRFPGGVGNYAYLDSYREHGLKPIADAAHREGMKFLLWFEPYRVKKGNQVHREHPEYLLDVDWEEAPVIDTAPEFCLLNLGDDEAYDYIYGVISGIIRDNHVDYYREDNNFPPLDYWRRNDEPSRDGVNEIRFINNLYRLWDSLRAEFPGLLVDNCNSGGKRLDFESMRRTVTLWRCDGCGGPVYDKVPTDIWSMNENLSLSEYVPYHATGAWELSAYIMRASITSGFVSQHDILNPDFDYDTAQKAMKEVAHYSCYWDGDFYPMTEFTMDMDCFTAYQLAKGDAGYVTVFRRPECPESDYVIRFNAVDPGALYEIRLSDESRDVTFTTAMGAELAEGYRVTLPVPQSSLIVEYLKIR